MALNKSGGSSTGCGEVAAATSVISKIPEFWRDQARLWFTQFEAVIAPQKQGDDYKYNMVVAKLAKEEIIQVSDILTSPPEADKYLALKERLIRSYEESEQQQFQKLLSGMELGDQKPSQLLRRMRELARGKMNEDTIRIMWLRLLPSSVTTVLAISEELSVDKLSTIADKILENARLNQVSAVNTSNDSDLHNSLAIITSQLAKMQVDICALQGRQHSRPTYRNFNRNHFSRSRSRSNNRQRNLCFYHYKYRNAATRCEKPCDWKISTQDQGN